MEAVEGEAGAELIQLLEEWKKGYTKALIDTLQPNGDVLEVGFDAGYAAVNIAMHNPKSHTIVESNREGCQRAIRWARNFSNVAIVNDSWQTALPSLGTFDAIFFNGYSSKGGFEMLHHLESDDLRLVTERARSLLSSLESEFEKTPVHFSDRDIDVFFAEHSELPPTMIESFFCKLVASGHITKEQYDKIASRYNLAKKEARPSKANLTERTAELLNFFNQCVAEHMHIGSRFSCFLNEQLSTAEGTPISQEIHNNPSLKYEEKVVPIKLQRLSPRVKFKDALTIAVVEKIA